MSLDSNASTAAPSAATPKSINLDGEMTAAQPLSVGIAPADLVCTTIPGNLLVANQGVSQYKLDEQEAENLLIEFKANMAEQFPFVVIQPNYTSQSLHHDRPLLSKAIIVAASHENSDRQMALGADLMENLTTRLLFRAEKSLDILQALLILIAWYEYSAL